LKGFTKDHKFIPISDYKKVTRKSRDQKTIGVRLAKTVMSIENLPIKKSIKILDEKDYFVFRGLVLGGWQIHLYKQFPKEEKEDLIRLAKKYNFRPVEISFLTDFEHIENGKLVESATVYFRGSGKGLDVDNNWHDRTKSDFERKSRYVRQTLFKESEGKKLWDQQFDSTKASIIQTAGDNIGMNTDKVFFKQYDTFPPELKKEVFRLTLKFQKSMAEHDKKHEASIESTRQENKRLFKKFRGVPTFKLNEMFEDLTNQRSRIPNTTVENQQLREKIQLQIDEIGMERVHRPRKRTDLA
jgi:hypothetical protein